MNGYDCADRGGIAEAKGIGMRLVVGTPLLLTTGVALAQRVPVDISRASR